MKKLSNKKKSKPRSGSNAYPYPVDFDPLDPQNDMDFDPIYELEKLELAELIKAQKKDASTNSILYDDENKNKVHLDMDSLSIETHSPASTMPTSDLIDISEFDAKAFTNFNEFCKYANLTEKQTNYLFWRNILRKSITEIANNEMRDESTIREHLEVAIRKIFKSYDKQGARKHWVQYKEFCDKINLTEKQADYFFRHKFLNVTISRIAKDNGCHESSIREHINAAEKKFSKYFKNKHINTPEKTPESE